MGDGLHRAIQQAAIVRHEQRRAGEAGEPAFQPEGGFQVQVVGRFVEQQQVGIGEQRGGQRHAHAPAAGEFLHGARLRGFVETQAGEDGGGAGRGRIGADRAQALVDFGEAVRVGAVRFGQQGQAFGVALQHRVQQGGLAGGSFLRHGRHACPGGQADVAAVERDFAHDGTQQCGFAGAVAPDQADATAGVHGEVGAVQDGAAAQADGGGGDDEQGHGGGLIGRVGGGGQVIGECLPRTADTRYVSRMTKTFRGKAAMVFLGDVPKGFPSQMARVARRKPVALDMAERLDDMRQPPEKPAGASGPG